MHSIPIYGVLIVKLECWYFLCIELQRIKRILDNRIRRKNVCVGRFTLKPRIDSSPSTVPMPANPVKWAVKRFAYIKSFISKGQLEYYF